VALLIEATHGYGRSLLTGVARFVRSNRNWRVSYQPWMLGSVPPEWLVPGACEGINVEDILDFLAADSIQISRSTLEHRFMQVRGRSPKEEILRIHLDRAKTRLRDTEHSISQIGDMVGIPRVQQFSALFRAKVGVTKTYPM
jgi:hypothetical protein